MNAIKICLIEVLVILNRIKILTMNLMPAMQLLQLERIRARTISWHFDHSRKTINKCK